MSKAAPARRKPRQLQGYIVGEAESLAFLERHGIKRSHPHYDLCLHIAGAYYAFEMTRSKDLRNRLFDQMLKQFATLHRNEPTASKVIKTLVAGIVQELRTKLEPYQQGQDRQKRERKELARKNPLLLEIRKRVDKGTPRLTACRLVLVAHKLPYTKKDIKALDAKAQRDRIASPRRTKF